MIDIAIRRGLLRPVHRGVYAVGHSALPPLAPLMAAALAVGGEAFISHRAASWLWGLSADAGPDIDVMIASGDRGRRRAGIRVHRDVGLDLGDTTQHENIPVTTPARTLLDLAPVIPTRDLERAFNAVLTCRLATRGEIAELARRSTRHPGTGQLALMANGELRVPGATASEAEERFLALVRAAGLPLPRTNVRVAGYEVDALWPDQRVIVEIDGYAFHSTHPAFEADHGRDLLLGAKGYLVLRFTYEQLVRRPELVIAALVRCLTERRDQLGRSSRIVS